MRLNIVGILALSVLAGCTMKSEHDQLAQRVEQLEAQVKQLEAKGPIAAKTGANAASAEDEKAAMAIYKEVDDLMKEASFGAAKKKIAQLLEQYPKSRAASRAIRTKRELDVVGKSVKTPKVEQWYVGGRGDLDLEEGATLVVFWEQWCPHCKREVPELEATFKKYKGRMDVVGLTKITKSSTEEKVVDFIKEQGVTYPMAKENGDISKEFAVSGIPAAAIVKDGEIVWRGHPGRLDDDLIKKLIKG